MRIAVYNELYAIACNDHIKTEGVRPIIRQSDKCIGWSSSKIVFGSCALPPRWPPQCSCVVIESSFDPGERLQAPGKPLV
jgi:hypothetical protein